MDKSKLNPYFQELDVDYLYHLGLDTSMDLAAIFGDVKYVIFTLSNAEASIIANEFARSVYRIHGEHFTYQPIYKTERFHMYKVGVSIVISIGVGMPSLLICINEITKLLVHLRKYDVAYLKVGFCGGIGVDDGNTIISHQIVNAKFEPIFESVECGKIYNYPTTFKNNIAHRILQFNRSLGHNNMTEGINLCTHDFSDEQARMNGAIAPGYTKDEANKYLNDAYARGIRSTDMESLAFAGFCNWLEIPGCVIGVSIVNRLVTEDISLTMDRQLNVLRSVANTLIRYIKANNDI
ncbi:MAG: hypothetical protein K2X63_06645 [Burkholderiaceae bacterium]|nr:hypothetical protein [Burkholderiaceae bacterium]